MRAELIHEEAGRRIEGVSQQKRGRPEGAGPPSDSDEPGARGKRKGHRREQRRARHAELKQKESDGKLSDGEEQELGKIERVRKRHRALKGKHAKRGKSRIKRRRAARRKALAEFPGLLKNNSALAEYGKHGQRMAQLERAREVAEAEGLDDLVKRIDKLMAREKERHQKWVAKHKGGTK